MSSRDKYEGAVNQLTRETFETPDVKKFYATRLTTKRAQIIASNSDCLCGIGGPRGPIFWLAVLIWK